MKIIGFLLASLLPGLAFAAAESGPARMDHIVQLFVEENHAAGAVLVTRGDTVLLDKGYGTTIDTPRPIGVITMQVTAAAILLLQEDGRLRIDDPLSKYLPETPAGWSKITLRHLLAQRSGVGGFENFPDPKALLEEKPAPRELEKRIFAAFPAPEPDKDFALSSPNYILLGLVIEQASGTSYADFVQKRIFTPLGMSRTSLPASTPDSALTGFLYSAGGIVSTTGDLRRFEQGLYGGKLLSPASLQAMLEPSGPEKFYGLGTFMIDEDGHRLYGNETGMLDGNGGLMAWRPHDRIATILLGKGGGDATDLGSKLSAVARGKKVVLRSELASTAQPNVLIPVDKFPMPGLNRDRGLRLYVPPDYSDHPERRYPVIYMHDGQNLFDVKTAAYQMEWGVDKTLNDLAKKTGFEAIVVGIDNGAEKRMSELNPYPGPKLKEAEGPDYMRFIVEVVKPYIDKTYRTLPDREHTAIMGSSMGGLISHYALQAYPQVFSKYGIFSPSYWASPELVDRAEKQELPPDTRLYVYCGGKEAPIMEDKARAMAATLARQGPAENVTLHINPEAQHNEKAWQPEFRTAVTWLFSISDKDSQVLSHR